MIAETSRPFDPAQLAASVRDIAADAHRAIHDPATTADEAQALTRRIRRIERQVRPWTFEDLGQWLANLRRELEERTASRPQSETRP